MHSFLSLSETAGGYGNAACPPQRAGCQRLQAALSRMREDTHHAACLQPHVRDNSWEKWKHGIRASACKIPRAVGSFLKVHWGSHGLGRVPGSGTGAKKCLSPVCKRQGLLDLRVPEDKNQETNSTHSGSGGNRWKGNHTGLCRVSFGTNTAVLHCVMFKPTLIWGLESGFHGLRLAVWKVERRMLCSLYKWNGACKSSQAYSIHHPR